LAQELITRDQVDLLAGFVLSPTPWPLRRVAGGEEFMVVMNAATSIITPIAIHARTSLTIRSSTKPSANGLSPRAA